MDRRGFLLGAGVCCAVAGSGRAINAAAPLGPGPFLFLDDHWIETCSGLERRVHAPVKHPEPVLTSAAFGVTQPYLSVLRDEATGRFRIWYNHGPAIWTAESGDGVRWENPRVAWDLPRGYGCSIVRDPDTAVTPDRRYKLANWQSTHALDDTPKDNGGMYVGFSPDGLRWTAHPGNPVLPTWPEGYGKVVRTGVGDTVDIFWDPLRKRFAAAVKVPAFPKDGYAPAPRAGKLFRRLVGMSTSRDFVRWESPHRILVPDGRDEGLLEFYGMGGMHTRGDLTIGLVRVLRAALSCDPGGPNAGIGCTTLAVSRDGRTWERRREPFLDRSLTAGSWAHAMAWGSAAVPVDDELYLYFGGYARGHKIAASTERQIGLARMKRDRYLSRTAGSMPGTLRTRAFPWPGGTLTLNADAAGGEVRARFLDRSGKPVPGCDWSDSAPITSDALAAEVRWRKEPALAPGTAVQLELQAVRAGLFAFAFR